MCEPHVARQESHANGLFDAGSLVDLMKPPRSMTLARTAARLRGARGEPRSRPWPLVSMIALSLSGALLSTFVATQAAHADGDKSLRAFSSLSSEVASSLQLQTQHEEDLLLSGGAYLAGNPRVNE